MYSIARRCVLPSLTQEQREHLLTEAALQSLAHMLEAVPEPRGAHGLRYDLPFLLLCLIAALLCNCDGTEAVAQWYRDHVPLLREVFGPRLFLQPSGSLSRWLLPPLDANASEQVLANGCKPARRPRATSRWLSMAKPCEEPDAGRSALLIC